MKLLDFLVGKRGTALKEEADKLTSTIDEKLRINKLAAAGVVGSVRKDITSAARVVAVSDAAVRRLQGEDEVGVNDAPR